MRLTLRTMLAYMDELLEPADHQDVGQKIEESEFATTLVHRIRDVTRRMRLGAPKVSGRGMGLDPNTVAEYIDNELSSERVPDFEKVCLESDIHLAEVAACHQILRWVLTEPADVDQRLRERMYQIESRAEPAAGALGTASLPRAEALGPTTGAAAVAQEATSGGGATRADQPTPARERPEVPEYLRSESRSRFKSIAIVAVLAACLVVAIVMAAGGLDRGSAVWKMLGLSGKDEQQQTAQVPTEKGPSAANESKSSTADDAKKGTEAGSADKTTSTVETKGGPEGAEKQPGDGSAKTPGGDLETKQPKSDSGDQGLVVPKPLPPELPNEKPAPPAPLPPEPAVPLPPVPDTGNPSGNANDLRPGSPAVPGPTTGAPIPPQPMQPGVATRPDQGEGRLGRLISAQEVLLYMKRGGDQWHRVSVEMTFAPGDQLLVLPTYRPTITLAAGVTLQIWPESLIELEGVDPQGVPSVRLVYGRMEMMTTGKADVRIQLLLGDSTGTVTFSDAEATAAAEVRRYHPPGTNPETHEPKTAATLYGVSGTIQWNSASLPAAGQTLKAPSRLALAIDPATSGAADRELPKWIGAEPTSPLDRRASEDLNAALDEKQPVTQVLRELADHRRPENKSLAARSLAMIGEFEPFDNLLNDSDQRAVWPTQVECLVAALARGPAVAAKVRETFEKQRGKDGGELYRMLWGYSKDDLQGGEAGRLVEFLDHESLDYRVLSFYNLRNLTGVTFNYRPEATSVGRQPAMRRWREQLKEGLIVPKGSAPAPAAKAAAEPTSAPPASPLPPAAGSP